MKTFKVPVRWEMTGTAFITAKTKKEAKEMLRNEQFDDILFEEQSGSYEMDGDIEEDCNG